VTDPEPPVPLFALTLFTRDRYAEFSRERAALAALAWASAVLARAEAVSILADNAASVTESTESAWDSALAA
jgi:hypothetical protein